MRLFAQQGNAQARQAMYAKFAVRQIFGVNFIEEVFTGAEEFIELDGIDGFLFVAERIGEQVLSVEGFWADDYLLKLAQERCGAEETWRALNEASAENPRIRAYVVALQENRTHREQMRQKRPHPSTLSYDQIKLLIPERGWQSLGFSLQVWGQQAGEEDLVRAAADLLDEKNELRLHMYLQIFSKRRFPLDLNQLIELAHSSNYRTAALALRALENISDPALREFALELMESSKQQGRAVGLLIHNHHEGDYQIIEALAAKLVDEEEIHSLGFKVLDFFKAHPNGDAMARLMLMLYEKGPCSICREKFIDILLSVGMLPDWMRAECQHDANSYLRARMFQPLSSTTQNICMN